MAVSKKRLEDFQARGAKGMTRWLKVATKKYYLGEDRDRWAFEPFGLFIGGRDSLASDIKAIYRQLSPEGQADFEEALGNVLGNMPADPNNTEKWRFLIELAWLLPAPEAIKVMERRFTDSFFDSLCAENGGLFDEIFLFVTGTAVTGPEAERCVRRMVASPRFDFHYSRHALLRLCEIAPQNWTNHFALTRDKLHDLFHQLRLDEAEKVQDELAKDILSVISFDGLFEGIDGGLDSRAQDIWFWRALLEERTGKLISRGTKTGGWEIAPKENPSYWRPIPKGVTFSNPPPVASEIEWISNGNLENADLDVLAQVCLLPSHVGMPEA